jgi:hypothetical protein
VNDNLSTKRVLVYDGGGLFVSLALRLAQLGKFKSVDYMREWQDGFCNGSERVVGSGLEEFGVGRLKYFWRNPEGDEPFRQYDLIIFPDVWQPDLQEYLRSLGIRVWGSGFKSRLEQARWETKELIGKIGLKTNESELIHGMTALREYLKNHENVFVKISSFRGMSETFPSKSYDLVKSKLDTLESSFGPIMELTHFIVEADIPNAKEVGYDGYCIDGEFPDKSFYGYEIKNKAYFGKLVDYDELPGEVKEANTKLSYHMDGYRQFWSTELRNGFVIDITARHASPAGETFCQAFDNLSEILWYGAGGVLVHARSSSKFVAQIILCSEWAESHPLAIKFPDKIRPFVKIYNHCRVGGIDYCIPDETRAKEIASVVGLGNTVEEACKAAKEMAKQVEGFGLHAECEALDEAVKLMEDEL